ncbi:MAG: hypothetical protein R2830_08480 [Saprospiraceae bacterium]
MKTSYGGPVIFLFLFLAQPCVFAQNRVPALSSTIPNAFAQGYLGSIGAGGALQSRSRLTSNFIDPDANAAFAIGLGNPEKWIGVDFRLNIYGIGNNTGASDNFLEGTVEFHLTRQLARQIWAGAGVYDLAGWDNEPANKLRSVYLTLTGVLPLRPGEGHFFKTCYLTAGVGNGRFRTDGQYDVTREGGVGVFGSAAFQVLPEGNFVIEWTGYNLYTGFSVFPFKKLPAQLTIGVDDIFHENWHFVLAGTIGFQILKNRRKTIHHGTTIMPPPPPQTSRVF